MSGFEHQSRLRGHSSAIESECRPGESLVDSRMPRRPWSELIADQIYSGNGRLCTKLFDSRAAQAERLMASLDSMNLVWRESYSATGSGRLAPNRCGGREKGLSADVVLSEDVQDTPLASLLAEKREHFPILVV